MVNILLSMYVNEMQSYYIISSNRAVSNENEK